MQNSLRNKSTTEVSVSNERCDQLSSDNTKSNRYLLKFLVISSTFLWISGNEPYAADAYHSLLQACQFDAVFIIHLKRFSVKDGNRYLFLNFRRVNSILGCWKQCFKLGNHCLCTVGTNGGWTTQGGRTNSHVAHKSEGPSWRLCINTGFCSRSRALFSFSNWNFMAFTVLQP